MLPWLDWWVWSCLKYACVVCSRHYKKCYRHLPHLPKHLQSTEWLKPEEKHVFPFLRGSFTRRATSSPPLVKRDFGVWRTHFKAGFPGCREYLSVAVLGLISAESKPLFILFFFISSKLTVSCSCSAKLVFLSAPLLLTAAKLTRMPNLLSTLQEAPGGIYFWTVPELRTPRFPSAPTLGNRNPPGSYQTHLAIQQRCLNLLCVIPKILHRKTSIFLPTFLWPFI